MAAEGTAAVAGGGGRAGQAGRGGARRLGGCSAFPGRIWLAGGCRLGRCWAANSPADEIKGYIARVGEGGPEGQAQAAGSQQEGIGDQQAQPHQQQAAGGRAAGQACGAGREAWRECGWRQRHGGINIHTYIYNLTGREASLLLEWAPSLAEARAAGGLETVAQAAASKLTLQRLPTRRRSRGPAASTGCPPPEWPPSPKHRGATGREGGWRKGAAERAVAGRRRRPGLRCGGSASRLRTRQRRGAAAGEAEWPPLLVGGAPEIVRPDAGTPEAAGGAPGQSMHVMAVMWSGKQRSPVGVTCWRAPQPQRPAALGTASPGLQAGGSSAWAMLLLCWKRRCNGAC